MTINLPNIDATGQLRDDDDEQIVLDNIVEAENAEILEECNFHWESYNDEELFFLTSG